MLTVGSLFAGIGGLDLGLERAGMQVRWQVEFDPYCNRVLEKHWPGVKRYGDIKQVNWSEVESVDVICGGFPCQPVSCAGKQKGDSDDRWLWPEFLRAIREVRPKYAIVENVPGLLSVDDGRLARRVFGDLAEIGYDAKWGIVSAASVGAPHLRQRVFIVAHPKDEGATRGFGQPRDVTGLGGVGEDDGSRVLGNHSEDDMADSESVLQGHDNDGDVPFLGSGTGGNSDVPYGRASWWAVEPGLGRVADGVPNRVDRLKCLGNAVVPQVAEVIAWFILEIENQKGDGRTDG